LDEYFGCLAGAELMSFRNKPHGSAARRIGALMRGGPIALAAVAGAPQAACAAPPESGAPARPGHIAELQELDAARKAGTIAAYDLFLARHPQSRYAPQARAERATAARTTPPRP
jgi:hypothetical protein